MKKGILLIFICITVFCCKNQNDNFKQYTICIDSAVHKGKINHNKYYCTGQATIREYKNGKKDTVMLSFDGGELFVDDEYEKYKKLPERTKYILDSLKEDGVSRLQSEYLLYKVKLMEVGNKTEQFWDIQGEDVIIYEYLFWKYNANNGFELKKEFTVK